MYWDWLRQKLWWRGWRLDKSFYCKYNGIRAKSSEYLPQYQEKGKHSIMQKTIIILLLFTYSYSSNVNPSNYVWLNYDARVAVKSKNPDQLTVTLPCQARIGKCSCSYTSLPLNWQLFNNCSIVFPREDSTKYGGFAVKATMSEVTGESVNVDLVINFNNGYLKLTDRSAFMTKNKYDDSAPPNNLFENGYGESILMNSQPMGFPTLLQLDLLVSSGNIFSISTTLNNILQMYAPCNTRIPYLTAVKKSLDQQISQNNLKKSNNENDLSKLEDDLINLDSQRQQQIKKSGIQTKLTDAKLKLNMASKDLVALMGEEIKYKNLAGGLLKKMVNSSSVDKSSIITAAQAQIKILTTSLEKIDRWLQSAFTNRKILRKAQLDIIIQIALQICNLSTNRSDVKQIVNNYNSNTLDLINNQIDQFQTMIKMNDLKQLILMQPKSNITTNQSSVANQSDKRVGDLNQQNNNLNRNIDILQQVVKKLQNVCQQNL